MLAEELAVVRQRGLHYTCLDKLDRRAGNVAALVGVEEERVEERAQEMAAQMIQAQVRGNMVRKAFASRTLP